ncbi:hypothetical protein BJ875DRAFT_436398 [Amylocarpus encephaloides]|uniref:Uncharacterized protein n=1 Tax=Amylocarpus encephaloides TaxID=45428 RepID=A0A9P8CAL9_9HELO|nr:hypothetical protein BJ875DRAFT_436398 [Amylocarpus encephaloides]
MALPTIQQLSDHLERREMTKNIRHKGKRGGTPWTKDITLITCILRLRAQPPVPYPRIADFLISKKLATNQQLASQTTSSAHSRDAHTELKEWMMDFLPGMLETAEKEKATGWEMAREWDDGVVGEILQATKLAGEGYRVVEREEMEMQIKWRREGDWRAGSEPLSRPLGRALILLKGALSSRHGAYPALDMPGRASPSSSGPSQVNHGWNTPQLIPTTDRTIGVEEAQKDKGLSTTDKDLPIKRKSKDSTGMMINEAQHGESPTIYS